MITGIVNPNREAILRLSRVTVFERGREIWALAVCDQRCLAKSAAALGVTLPEELGQAVSESR